MTKQQHIGHWKEMAERDWGATQSIAAEHGHSSLVFAHWTLEKLSKALWIQHHDALPPATDTVATILAETPFHLTPTQLHFTQHLEAAHDEVLDPDPERPLQLQQTPQQLLQQADTLRMQLLEVLHVTVE
jgi:hypothetical protein